MPSNRARGIYERMLPLLDESMLLVSATKGLETGSLLRMSEVIGQVVANRFTPKVAVLSGTTFAQEGARGGTTAVVVASTQSGGVAEGQQAVSRGRFRRYTNRDATRAEIR